MTYNRDQLQTNNNAEFLSDPKFQAAYARGVQAAGDYNWEWRVHTGLWVARQAMNLSGDFVECGTNRGFMASAILTDLNWNATTERKFWLCDTWNGMDTSLLTPQEIEAGYVDLNRRRLEIGNYTTDFEKVAANFADWKNIELVQGSVPESLEKVRSKEVAFLHLDMNCAAPELAALNHFWNLLVPGAFVLADDYCYIGYEIQGTTLRNLAESLGTSWLSIPTGQGLLIKP